MIMNCFLSFAGQHKMDMLCRVAQVMTSSASSAMVESINASVLEDSMHELPCLYQKGKL